MTSNSRSTDFDDSVRLLVIEKGQEGQWFSSEEGKRLAVAMFTVM